MTALQMTAKITAATLAFLADKHGTNVETIIVEIGASNATLKRQFGELMALAVQNVA